MGEGDHALGLLDGDARIERVLQLIARLVARANGALVQDADRCDVRQSLRCPEVSALSSPSPARNRLRVPIVVERRRMGSAATRRIPAPPLPSEA